jgi:hypothetical protein
LTPLLAQKFTLRYTVEVDAVVCATGTGPCTFSKSGVEQFKLSSSSGGSPSAIVSGTTTLSGTVFRVDSVSAKSAAQYAGLYPTILAKSVWDAQGPFTSPHLETWTFPKDK